MSFMSILAAAETAAPAAAQTTTTVVADGAAAAPGAAAQPQPNMLTGMLPIIIVFLLFQKYFTKGVMIGAVKG